MQIIEGIEIVDLALWLQDTKTLIISDLHIGYEEALNKQGIMVPRFHYPDLDKKLKAILDQTNPELIIINGDLKHEFGRISETEWRHTIRIMDLLLKHAKVLLIKGNHDNIAGPLAEKRNLELVEDYYFEDKQIYVCHGNIIPDKTNENFKNSKTVIIGHEHPAVSIKSKTRVEKFKAFLKGKYENKTLIVQPSFNPIIEGTDILQEQLLSPFLKQNLENFEAFVVADEVYEFGKLKNIKKSIK
ncbi:metallophosphoesterase [Nanoarchaeota archaeon]